MTLPDLPDEVVSRLNELGFALAEGDLPYTFIRFMIGGECRLLVQAISVDRWRVGLGLRAAEQSGRMPNPLSPVALARFAPSSDGTTLEFSTAELREDLPRLLQEQLLPSVDAASG